MTIIVSGLFKSPAEAAQAVRLLQERGIDAREINFVASDDFDRHGIKHEPTSKATAGMIAGSVGGGALGALIGGLTAVQVIATGGAGLGLLVGGPHMAALIGGGSGAAVGGTLGGLIGAAIPEQELPEYERAIRQGTALVGVKTENAEHAEIVRATLEELGAEKVSAPKTPLVKKLVENNAEAKLRV